jgi:hypothetical protein
MRKNPKTQVSKEGEIIMTVDSAGEVQVGGGLPPQGPSQPPGAVTVTPAGPRSFGKDWERENCGKPVGEYIQAAIHQLNAEQRPPDTDAYRPEDISDIEVKSIDPKTGEPVPDDELGVRAKDGKAQLVVEYWITVTKNGKKEKIRIQQIWDTDCKIPTPGSLDERFFEREVQTVFIGIRQKIKSALVANKNAGPSGPEMILSSKKLKELCTLTHFDWMKDASTTQRPWQVEGRNIEPLPIGSKTSGRAYITGCRVDGVWKRVSPKEYKEIEQVYSRKVTCPELEHEQEQLETVEEIVAQAKKAGKPVDTSRLREATKETHARLLRDEIQRAGDEARELAGAHLGKDRHGKVTLPHNVDEALSQASYTLSIAHIAQKAYEDALPTAQPILAEINDIRRKCAQEKKPDAASPVFEAVLDTETWESNDTWLEERGVIPKPGSLLPHRSPSLDKPTEESEKAAEKKAEKAEIKARLKLREAFAKINKAKSEVERDDKLLQQARSVLIDSVDRLKEQYQKLNQHLDTLRELWKTLQEGHPDRADIAKQIATLNKTLIRLGYKSGELGARILAFEETVRKQFPARQAGVASPGGPSQPPPQHPAPPPEPPPKFTPGKLPGDGTSATLVDVPEVVDEQESRIPPED